MEIISLNPYLAADGVKSAADKRQDEVQKGRAFLFGGIGLIGGVAMAGIGDMKKKNAILTVVAMTAVFSAIGYFHRVKIN